MSDVLARLSAKINLCPSGCWLWTAALNDAGYGVVWIEGRTLRAHRVIYELVLGPIPPGLQLDHLCRVRHCVNPAHLEPVTQAENIGRGHAGTLNRERILARTHCKYGHEFSPDNIYRHRDGRRECRTCRARRERSRWGR